MYIYFYMVNLKKLSEQKGSNRILFAVVGRWTPRYIPHIYLLNIAPLTFNIPLDTLYIPIYALNTHQTPSIGWFLPL